MTPKAVFENVNTSKFVCCMRIPMTVDENTYEGNDSGQQQNLNQQIIELF